MSGNTSTYMND